MFCFYSDNQNGNNSYFHQTIMFYNFTSVHTKVILETHFHVCLYKVILLFVSLFHSDAPTTAPAWQRPLYAAGMTDRRSPDVMKVKVTGRELSSDVDAPIGATLPHGQFDNIE